MGRSRTINLTRASEGNHIERVLKRTYVYDQQIADRCALKRQHFKQLKLIDKIYTDKFKKLNHSILNDINDFVKSCIDTRDESLFVRGDGESIFGSILNLDMRISDHEPTFDMIESNLKRIKGLNVARIKVSVVRKRDLVDMLEPFKQSKRLLILVERAETLSRPMTDTLIGYLKGRIADNLSPTTVVMILFCISTHIQQLPFDHVNCLGRMNTITKDDTLYRREVKEELFRCRGIRMKLGPAILNHIFDYFMNVDASISSVIYMLNQATFQYYYNLEELYDKMNTAARKAFLEVTTERHQYLCDQMYYFMELLEESDLYPEDVTDIYDHLVEYQQLTRSIDFVDALKNLRKYSHEAILRRIDNVLTRSQQFQTTKNGQVDVISILTNYKEKLVNNKDCSTIVTRLIDDLLNYAQHLESPLKKDENGVYLTNNEELSESTLTAVRNWDRFLKYFCQDKTYFGILLEHHVLYGSGQMGVHDLALDVADEYKEIMRLDRSSAIKRGPRIKFTPKKRKSKSSKSANQEAESNQSSVLSPEDEDGLVKALFVDVIDNMELQCLVKLDPKNKGKHIKRLTWPCPKQKGYSEMK